jgi:hypothetical protein
VSIADGTWASAGGLIICTRNDHDVEVGDLGPAFPAWTGPRREPILQPPKPEIPPSPRILERVMDRDADWEAAD